MSSVWKYHSKLAKLQGGIFMKYKGFLSCAKVYKVSISTGVFWSHLKKHGKGHDAENMVQSQELVGINMAVTTATAVESLQTKFDEALVKCVVKKSKPFHMVKHESFKDTYFVVNWHITVPSQHIIQMRFLKKAENLQTPLKSVVWPWSAYQFSHRCLFVVHLSKILGYNCTLDR